MFMTAGSCSVILLCPTRRILSCHGCFAGSNAGKRGGRPTSVGIVPASGELDGSSAEKAHSGRKTSSAAAKGRAEAPLLRKFLRLGIRFRPGPAVYFRA